MITVQMKNLIIIFIAVCLNGLVANAQNFTLKSHELNGQLTEKQFFNGMGFTGGNQSPELYWENPPSDTRSFAITIYDMDAPTGSGFWHWVVFNIPANIREIKSGAGDLKQNLLPPQAIQSLTDLGTPGFTGAAPNEGPAHRYLITVYALSKVLELTKTATPAYVGYNLNFSTIARASLVVYGQRH
ncbi:YbhB/YbcL family Raf kinase inhibitor-like protein [Mucilaginibacter sp. 22184]|uniref:YbhB/YbcL family Raf kinase inhibitor-like protein n=1 Tax=Mucilaginibacter sp. 22184 TaxID=3453887 RepID=UPI003F877235